VITRDFQADWRAGCAGAPPPLHVVDDNPAANYPGTGARPPLAPHPPGPVWIHIPSGSPVGDDPLDPSAQTERRYPTLGMMGRFNFALPGANIAPGGARV